jgi:hypothetical protein
MKIAEIRHLIDCCNWRRHDFSGHTREEFVRANVGEAMGEHIAKLRALEIPPRFARDIQARDSAIEYAQKQIDRWNEMRAEQAAAPAKVSAPTLRLVPPTASWVIKRKADGAVITETFSALLVEKLNTEQYEAVPIRQHLASLSQQG